MKRFCKFLHILRKRADRNDCGESYTWSRSKFILRCQILTYFDEFQRMDSKNNLLGWITVWKFETEFFNDSLIWTATSNQMSAINWFFLLNTRMQAVISMPSKGKGAFALRKDLKTAKGTICSLLRSPTNEFGTSSAIFGWQSTFFCPRNLSTSV